MGLFGSSFNQADPSGYLMNIGQQQIPQNPWEMATQPTQQQAAQQFRHQYGQYQTPGIGDGIPGNPQIGDMHAPQLPVDPRAAQAARPGFFGKGGKGWGILGVIGDGLQVAGGGRATYQDYMQQQQEYAQRLQELQAEREARRAERMMPRAEQVGNAIGMLDPATGQFTPTYTAPPQQSEQERLIDAWGREQDPERKAMIERAIRGFQYTPEVMDARTQAQIAVADHRLGNSLTLKRTPGASSGGGGGMGKLKVGQVVSGHTYIGGDPNNRASWR